LDDRLLETGFVTSASSSIRVILNSCGAESAGEFWRFLGGGRAYRGAGTGAYSAAWRRGSDALSSA
jgi:hypothetical protein